MARDYRVPAAWIEGGAWGWIEELQRQARVIGCKADNPLRARFRATARQLTLWRIRSAVQCSPAAIELVLPVLEETRRRYDRRLFGVTEVWSCGELGELICECRNRLALAKLGRDRARERHGRFELELIPTHRLEALIQRHPNMDLVERLRLERRRRMNAPLCAGSV